MVKITGVLSHSLAELRGVCVGDALVSINGHAINDVLDYRFYLADTALDVVLSRDGAEYSVQLHKREYDDIGLEFETPLMDKKRHCENKCVFCFIDQLPKGMRESLYFKDDDSRLSFLHGNYITMTNLHDCDIQRIIDMHISPINISVHTTNPSLRVQMMHNKRAGDVLKYLKMLSDGGCRLNLQIVLCRGVNDGDELVRTLTDLYELREAVESVAVVPAGLTGYRRGLYPLEPFTSAQCRDVIATIDAFADKSEKENGDRLFYASDEFYIRGETELPKYEKYGEFSQIENGVGMLVMFKHELLRAVELLEDDAREIEREVSIATGEAAFDMIKECAELASALCPNIKLHIYCVKNNFFGGEITVTGLLTATDLLDQLKDKELGEELLLSRTMLRAEGDMFLDSVTPEELSEKLGVKLRFTENDGYEFLDAILGV